MKIYTCIAFVLLILSFFSCDSDEPLITDLKTLEPITEIDLSNILSEPSGIVYNLINNSLYVVSDTISIIFEIDLNGNLLRQINIVANDLEGISLSKDSDTIYVVEESDNQVTSILTNGNYITSFVKNVSTNSSNGLEGIAIDNNYNTYVINEKLPRYVIILRNSVELSRFEITSIEDLSDICYDYSLDCLWLISDESKKIVKMSKNGILQSEWSIPFDKGEGITFINDKMYIVRDSNSKMYVFNKPN